MSDFTAALTAAKRRGRGSTIPGDTLDERLRMQLTGEDFTALMRVVRGTDLATSRLLMLLRSQGIQTCDTALFHEWRRSHQLAASDLPADTATRFDPDVEYVAGQLAETLEA